MSGPKTALVNKLIDIAFSVLDGLDSLNVNYQEVLDARAAAKAEGRDELNEEERAVFIDQARNAVDDL